MTTTAISPAPTRSGPQHARAVLAIILVSYFLILLDNSVIFTGLPSIAVSLRLSATGLSWVQDAYTLVFGGLLLLGARLGDLLGRRPVFVAGLAVFVTASFLVGGAATQWISWRAGFFINVPIGIAMAVLAPRYLPSVDRQRGRFDVLGAIAATAAVGSLVFGLLESVDRGWSSSVVLGSLAASAVLFAVLVLHEGRAEQPIMPLHLFADRRRWGAYAARALYLGAMMGFFFFTTQLMQGVLGFTAFEAGLGFLPMTAVNFAVATAVPRVTARLGEAITLVAGVALTLAGMIWLAQVDSSTSYLTGVALPMVLIGAGQGLAFAPLTGFGIAGARAADAGAASGLVNTAHQLGTAAGLAVLVAASATVPDLADRVSTALTWGSGLLAGALLVTVVVIVPGARRPRH